MPFLERLPWVQTQVPTVSVSWFRFGAAPPDAYTAGSEHMRSCKSSDDLRWNRGWWLPGSFTFLCFGPDNLGSVFWVGWGENYPATKGGAAKMFFFGGVGATYSISIALLQNVTHLSFMVQSTLRQSCGYWAGLCGHEWVHSSKSGAIHGLSWTGPFCDGKNGAVDLGWRLGVALSSTFWVRALTCHYQSIIYHSLDPKQFNKARGKGYINDGQKLVDRSCVLVKEEGQPRIYSEGSGGVF